MFVSLPSLADGRISHVLFCVLLSHSMQTITHHTARREAYLSCKDEEDKTIYSHVTDATNTENVRFVWKATQHIVLEKAVAGGGMMM
jgi:hypothetical protein